MEDIAAIAEAMYGGPSAEVHRRVEDWLGHRLGVDRVDLLLVDYAEEQLHTLGGGTVEAQAGALSASPPEGFLDEGTDSYWVPLRHRDQRIGYLRLEAREAPPARGSELAALGALLGLFLDTARQHADHFENARRRARMSTAAELQWSLLPVRDLRIGDLTMSGAVEPAYDIGGDSFDFSEARNGPVVAILDGMGRGEDAVAVVALSLAAIRNVRRSGGSLAEQAASVNELIHRRFSGERFLTLQLLQFGPDEVAIVNAGHPWPKLENAGEWSTLELAVDLPAGLDQHATYREQRASFGPGSTMVLYTDGVVEAAAPQGDPWGEASFEQSLRSVDAPTTRRLARKVIGDVLAHSERRLRDDATLVCIERHE